MSSQENRKPGYRFESVTVTSTIDTKLRYCPSTPTQIVDVSPRDISLGRFEGDLTQHVVVQEWHSVRYGELGTLQKPPTPTLSPLSPLYSPFMFSFDTRSSGPGEEPWDL